MFPRAATDGPSPWDNPKNVDTLRSMHAEGATASEIARALGQDVSRNAVTSKMTRLKLVREPRVRVDPAQGKRGRAGNPGQTSAKGILSRVAAKRDGVSANGQGTAAKIAKARAEGVSLDEVMHRKAPMQFKEDEGVDVTRLIAFTDRRIGKECSWIHGDALGAAMCCGKPVKEGTEWCPDHYARVFKSQSGAAA